jgi:hypothetical protein
MITVVVKRGLGNHPGPDISDAFIVSEHVAVDRGTVEIDKEFSDRAMVPTTGPFIGYIPPCSLVFVSEIEGQYPGIIDKCALTFEKGDSNLFTARTDLLVEKET